MFWTSIALLIVLAWAVAGCALPGVYSGMSAEQIAAAVKDKSSAIACISGKYMGGNVTVVHANADKGVPGTQITVDENCKVTLTTVTIPK